jgi:hypothetical protein
MSDCRRCGGTGTIIEQFCDPPYEWPPIRCGVCNPAGEPREYVHEEIYECPDCRIIRIEDDDE